ncbi:MAG TPA: hypothetical protein VFX98_14735 [Longimicrobiaceae bacterium]|nr:hypothetical protein [Longimicrobiaceae bacterium]
MAPSDREPPFEGGSQPVPQRPPDMPSGRRSAGPFLIVLVTVLILLSGLVWLFR